MTSVLDRMSTGVPAIRIDATLMDAARALRATGSGGLPVLDPETGGCAGILTERDIVVRALAEQRDARSALVRDVATLEPVICSPADDVGHAIALMRRHEVQHLPVLAEGEVVGVISLADIVFDRPDEERGAFDPGHQF